MTKNMTKANKPKTNLKTSVYERRIITAIRDNTEVSPDFIVKPINDAETNITVNTDIMLKTRKDVIQRVLTEANGKITMSDAIEKAKSLKTLKAKDPEYVWKWTFNHASVFGINAKVTTETFIELF